MWQDKNFTVITGASQGLGKSFAECCAKRGKNLILISLPNEGIQTFKIQLESKYQITIHVFELDLTKSEDLKYLVSELKNYPINALINNAGRGGTIPFSEASLDYLDSIVLLNMRSVVVLTHQLLPQLKSQEEAFILNISSLAAFCPMAFKTVYPASKAFIYSFSRGLQAELKNTNIHVAVAHPGGMPTNPEVTKRIYRHKGLVRFSILSPERTAEICYEKLMRRETTIIPGKINQLSSILQRLLPVNLQLNLTHSQIQKELELI